MISIKRRTYTEEDKDLVKKMAKEGMNISDVVKRTGFSRSSVSRIFSSIGLEKYKKDNPEEISRKMKIVEDMYLDNPSYTAKDVSEKTGIRLRLVERYICDLKIGKEKGVKTSIKNISYFDEIDTQEKAYFLGWIMADGCVSIRDGQYSIKIHIAKKDRYLIDEFQKAIGSSYPVSEKVSYKRGTRCESVYISATSRHMVESLERYGITPRKTGKERIPNNIPNDMKRHFLRGFFDGDGHAIFIKRQGYVNYNFGFTGPKDMLRDITSLVGVDRSIYQKEGVCQIGYGKKHGKILYDMMYEESTIKLNRKFEIMKSVYVNTEVTKILKAS